MMMAEAFEHENFHSSLARYFERDAEGNLQIAFNATTTLLCSPVSKGAPPKCSLQVLTSEAATVRYAAQKLVLVTQLQLCMIQAVGRIVACLVFPYLDWERLALLVGGADTRGLWPLRKPPKGSPKRLRCDVPPASRGNSAPGDAFYD